MRIKALIALTLILLSVGLVASPSLKASPLVRTTHRLDAIDDYWRPIYTTVEPISTCGAAAIYRLYRQPSENFNHHALYAHSRNHEYKLQVVAEGIRVFECAFRNGISLERDDAIQVADMNLDGFKDIRVLGGYRNDTGRPWFKVWVWDPFNNSYAWDHIEG